jgi:Tfp pilus assembly protein PilF
MTNPRLHYILEMLEKEPNDSFLRYALALEYARGNETQKAIEQLEDLLLNDVNYLGAYYQLGKYYEETEQQQKAAETYQKGIAIARLQNNKKTLGELNEALQQLED